MEASRRSSTGRLWSVENKHRRLRRDRDHVTLWCAFSHPQSALPLPDEVPNACTHSFAIPSVSLMWPDSTATTPFFVTLRNDFAFQAKVASSDISSQIHELHSFFLCALWRLPSATRENIWTSCTFCCLNEDGSRTCIDSANLRPANAAQIDRSTSYHTLLSVPLPTNIAFSHGITAGRRSLSKGGAISF